MLAQNNRLSPATIEILKWSSAAVFLGRAWQFLFWDAPYRTLLWDQQIMEGIIRSSFGMSWEDWAHGVAVDNNIQLSIRVTGLLFVLSAVACFVSKDKRKWPSYILWTGVSFLFILALLQTKEKFFHFGQFFEHASQIGAPVLLLLTYKRLNATSFIVTAKVLIALTFLCHGLYAINYYPRPGVFVDLLINTMGFAEEFAHQFIWVIGLVDIVAALLIFTPGVSRYVIWYCFAWGILTAFSRLTAGFYWDFPLQSLHQTMHTAVYRLVHGLLPLSILVQTGAIKMGTLKRVNRTSSLGTQ